jgi:hypothetical protein
MIMPISYYKNLGNQKNQDMETEAMGNDFNTYAEQPFMSNMKSPATVRTRLNGLFAELSAE